MEWAALYFGMVIVSGALWGWREAVCETKTTAAEFKAVLGVMVVFPPALAGLAAAVIARHYASARAARDKARR